MELSWNDIRRISAQAGHQYPAVKQTRRGWVGTCTCGYRSARTPDEQTASNLVAQHILRAVSEIYARQKASGRVAG